MPVDPHTIVLYHSIFKGEEVDTLLARIPGLGDVTTNLSTRVSTIEQQLAPHIILTVQQVKYVGGMRIESPAGAECISVEELARGYKCTFDTNHGSEPLLFDVYDQVLGMRFDLGTTTQNDYWRLVTEVGDDYIILSKTDCAPGSGVPQTGDCMITVGNRFTAARQNLQISSTIGTDAPRLEQYEGINDYNLSERLITVIGMKDGKMGVYTKNGEFSGEVHITDGSGLENLDEWAEAAQDIADAAAAAAAAADAAADAQRTADLATTKLNTWASDGIISPVEKEPLAQQWEDVKKEYTTIVADAVRYRVDASSFTAAYTLANAAFQKYTANPTESTTKESDYDNIAAYYTARATILTNIAIAAKGIVDAAQETADGAASAASAAQLTADAAAAKALQLEKILDQINDDTVLDPSEKNVIRTEWITINGTAATDRTGTAGSYYTTKKLYDQYKTLSESLKYTYAGKVYTYDNKVFTYKAAGVSDLDAAYLVLREYLRSVGINDKETAFEGFDRAEYSRILTRYYDAELYVQDNINKAIQNEIATTKAEILADLGLFETAINQTIEEMQGIIDNTIETWFFDGVPTLNNLPASAWTTEELLERHLGDLYYNQSTGIAYRFQRSGTEGDYTYYWYTIPDSAVAAALAAAAAAQDTADHKRRVFTAQPTNADAYDVGDLWLHATIGNYTDETLVCQTAKEAGVVFSAADWTTATKYTDDTVANLARQEAATAQSAADAAALAASAAQSTADGAAAAASAANTQLTNWASDGIISPVEKTGLLQQKEEIDADYSELYASATSYGVSTSAFTTAYNSAVTALNKYTANPTQNTTKESDYANIAAYYDARVTIANAIATAAKKVATDAQAAADAAALAASAAQTKANQAKSAADAAALAASAAQSTADGAAAAASTANTQLTNWASDGIISPIEKRSLVQQWEDVQAEYDEILIDAAKYSVSTTNYIAAYTAANTAFTKYTANATQNTTKESDYANIAAYYDARTAILTAIATAAKKVATDAAAAADAAQTTADQAKNAVDAINNDTILSPSEKAAIRIVWIGINGVASTGVIGEDGTYAAAKRLLAAADATNRKVIFTYGGKVYTYNGNIFTYHQPGEAQLDAAYLSLREYLSACQLDQDEDLPGFNPATYAARLRDYNVALNNVMGILSDVAKQTAEDTSMDTIAKNLGYTSFAEMEAAARAGETIVEGGYIRTNLINVATLIAKRLSTTDDNSLKSLTIQDNQIKLYDSNGALRTHIHANALSTPAVNTQEVFTPGLVNFTGLNMVDEVITGSATLFNFVASSGSDTIQGSGQVAIDFSIRLDLSQKSFADFDVDLAVKLKINGTTWKSNTLGLQVTADIRQVQIIQTLYLDPTTAQTLSSAGAKEVSVEFEVAPQHGLAAITQGVYGSVMVSGVDYTVTHVNSTSQITEVGTNGIQIVRSGSEYAQLHESNGGLEFKIITGSYGLRVNSSGVQKTVNGGSSWTSL